MITYELSAEQYKSLWNKYDLPKTAQYTQTRINYWNKNLKSKYKLAYIEYNDEDYGWYGILRGDQNNLNWFLLHI